VQHRSQVPPDQRDQMPESRSNMPPGIRVDLHFASAVEHAEHSAFESRVLSRERMGPHLIRLIIRRPHSIRYNPPDSITVLRESPRRWLVPADLKSESGLPVAGR
jgi:hypothetical protein